MAIVKTSRNERGQGPSSLLARRKSTLVDRVTDSFSIAYKRAGLPQLDYIDEDVGGSDLDMANAEAILNEFLLDDFPLILDDEMSNPPEDSPSSTSGVHFARTPAAEGPPQCDPVILSLDDEEMTNEDAIDAAIRDVPASGDDRELPGWNPVILSLNGATGTPLARGSPAPILDEEMANEGMLEAPVARDPPARTLKELPEWYPVVSPVARVPPAPIAGELPAWSPVISPINDAAVARDPPASILGELPGWAPVISPINYGAGAPVDRDVHAPILNEEMASEEGVEPSADRDPSAQTVGELPGWSPAILSIGDDAARPPPRPNAGELPGWSPVLVMPSAPVARDPPTPILDEEMANEALEAPHHQDGPHLISGELPGWNPVISPNNDDAAVARDPPASILRELPGWAPVISPINGADAPVNRDLPAPILDQDGHEPQELPGWNPVTLSANDDVARDPPQTPILDDEMDPPTEELPGWSPAFPSANATPVARDSPAPILDEEMANEDALDASASRAPPAHTDEQRPGELPGWSAGTPAAHDLPILDEEMDPPRPTTGELPGWSPAIPSANATLVACDRDRVPPTHTVEQPGRAARDPPHPIPRELPGWIAEKPAARDPPTPILDEEMDPPHLITGALSEWSAGMPAAGDPPHPIVDEVMSLAVKEPVARVPPAKLPWNWDVNPQTTTSHANTVISARVPPIENPTPLPDASIDGRSAPTMENPQIFGIFGTPFMPSDFHTAPRKPATYEHAAFEVHERPPSRGETVKFADDRRIRKADSPVSEVDSDEETIPPPRIQRKKFRILTPSDEEVEDSEAETPKPPRRRPSPLPPRRRNLTMEECEEAQVPPQNPRRSPSASWAPPAQRKNMVVEDASDGDDEDNEQEKERNEDEDGDADDEDNDGDDEDIYWGGDNEDNEEERERNEDGGGDGDADDEDNDEGGEGGSDNDDEEEDNPDHSPDGFWSRAPTDDLPRPQRRRPSPRSRSYSPNQEPQPDSPSEQMKQRRRRRKRTNNIVHDAADVAQLKAEVRELCDVDLLNIRKLGMIKVADPRDVQAYENEPQGPYQPSIEDFRPDLECSIFSLWNKRLGELFAEKFVESVQYSCKDKAAVAFTFKRHLYHLRDKYKDLTAPRTEANKMRKNEKKVAKSRENRQRALRHRRRDTCANMASRDESMRRCLALWDSMPYEVVSGDETDHGPSSSRSLYRRTVRERYAITKHPWRSPQVKEWFRTFDALHMATRFTFDDRACAGKFPHIRVESSRVSQRSRPIPGLPKNFYHPDFLRSLDDDEIEQLDPQPDFDLSFSRRVKFIAERFKDVRSRKDKPLSNDHPSLRGLKR